jgi:hypothetical protein
LATVTEHFDTGGKEATVVVSRSSLLVCLALLLLAVPTGAKVDDEPFRIRADGIVLAPVGEPDKDGRFTVELFGPALIALGKGDDREVRTTVFEAIARFRASLGPPCDPLWQTYTIGGCAESIEIDLPQTPEQLQVVCRFEEGAARLLGRCTVEGVDTEGRAKLVLIPGVRDGTIAFRLNGHYQPANVPSPNGGHPEQGVARSQ